MTCDSCTMPMQMSGGSRSSSRRKQTGGITRGEYKRIKDAITKIEQYLGKDEDAFISDADAAILDKLSKQIEHVKDVKESKEILERIEKLKRAHKSKSKSKSKSSSRKSDVEMKEAVIDPFDELEALMSKVSVAEAPRVSSPKAKPAPVVVPTQFVATQMKEFGTKTKSMFDNVLRPNLGVKKPELKKKGKLERERTAKGIWQDFRFNTLRMGGGLFGLTGNNASGDTRQVVQQNLEEIEKAYQSLKDNYKKLSDEYDAKLKSCNAVPAAPAAAAPASPTGGARKSKKSKKSKRIYGGEGEESAQPVEAAPAAGADQNPNGEEEVSVVMPPQTQSVEGMSNPPVKQDGSTNEQAESTEMVGGKRRKSSKKSTKRGGSCGSYGVCGTVTVPSGSSENVQPFDPLPVAAGVPPKGSVGGARKSKSSKKSRK